MSRSDASSETDSANITDEGASSSESSSDSAVESDFGYSDLESVSTSRMNDSALTNFSLVGRLSIDEVEDGLPSYESGVEDDNVWRKTETKTMQTVQLTKRVLQEGTRTGERRIFSPPLLLVKRITIGDRALARKYIDKAAVSSRALLHLELLQHRLPKTCTMRVAQFFRPTMSPLDIKRSFYRRWPHAPNVCVDIDALREVKPSWFVFDSKRQRRNPWESMHHALWCHAAWTRLFYPCALHDQLEEAI
eukprot:TRINITY_DN7744_c0_g4_i1.p1 TRINITY_DN7744_c0_g4~~TRINITY_DN7744_c0_g4_i1.p1  ORF type:complete len:249 (-),score=23.02 TRINITY_DN7744_c0_g4_i1:183-929(-)